MINIRGVNVYPTSIEAVVRSFPDVVEFRTTVTEGHAMRALSVDVELAPHGDPAAIADRIAIQLKEALGVSVRVRVVEAGALPRFEMKAKRFVVEV
jgi:phenylacetate-CoA ligase